MALWKRINHIKNMEANIRRNYGQQVTLKTFAGKVGCTHCGYDEFYNTSTNPNCEYCGGKYWINSYVTHNRYVKVHWVSLNDKIEAEAGDVEIGSCEIHADYADKWIYDNMQANAVRFQVEGVTLEVKIIVPTILRTQVKVECERVKDE